MKTFKLHKSTIITDPAWNKVAFDRVKQFDQAAHEQDIIGVYSQHELSAFYHIAELVQGEKEHFDWFPERSQFCFSDR